LMARLATVKLAVKKSFILHDVIEGATSCVQAGRGQISRKTDGLSRERTGKEQGVLS
jgi:hypothetical protein